jgi:hypothetical protein
MASATLVPRYAATIHKSQGPEYPAVVIRDAEPRQLLLPCYSYKLGEALRAQYELEEPLPETLITASSELGLDRGQLPEDE